MNIVTSRREEFTKVIGSTHTVWDRYFLGLGIYFRIANNRGFLKVQSEIPYENFQKEGESVDIVFALHCMALDMSSKFMEACRLN